MNEYKNKYKNNQENNMKTLVEYINESLQQINEELILFKPTAKNAQDAALVEDKIRSFLNITKKRYSLNSKNEIEKLFNDFIKFAELDLKLLKEFGIINGKSLAKLLINNKEKIEKEKWNLNAIKSFDKKEIEKEYEKWKNSDDYTPGKKLDKSKYKDASEEELKRVLVVYDRMDPGNEATVIEYDFNGKRTKENSHQSNMRKMDWAKETGLDYWKNANTILLSNYLKKSDAELAKREVAFDDSDLEEI